ncbi:MAG: ABC transporter permease [Synergistaceae bacterium]|jgi:osmoprotectant transport system permease protein|nr:ABC transporter permease [Synergistaceae bacterium]
MTAYLLHYYGYMLRAVASHAEMIALVMVFAIPISAALGVLIHVFRFPAVPVITILEILYTIPSLAFFAILVPISGLGVKSAVIVLVCYSLFFLVRNFLAGLEGIDPLVIEAARAMGYSRAGMFLKIELPMAMPALIAGTRLACMASIGIACIAYAIGAGGIGTILFEGMRQMSYVKIAWGAILVIALSVAVNNLMLALERYFTRRADPGRTE